jgi:hypothetical protein
MQQLILNAYPPPVPVQQKKTKKPDQKKGQRPQAAATTVSDLTDNIENLQVENGDSTSTINQNGSS